MFGLPLHPALVHVPLGLAAVLPLIVILVWLMIKKNWLPQKSWGLVLLLQFVLFGFGFLAMEAGEDEEDKVEQVVAEHVIHDHEEKAEIFLWGAGLLLPLIFLGMMESISFKKWVELMIVLGVFVQFGLSLWVGHSGGELVYKHGAAQVYSEPSTNSGPKKVDED